MADGAASFGQGSSGPALLRMRTRFARISHTGLSPSAAGLSRPLPLCAPLPWRPSYNPGAASTAPVWAGPLSLAATRGVTVVLLSSAYLDVSVRRVRLLPSRMTGLLPVGFPHSGIRGSTIARISPRLFAACCVLHRLREPRHPPCALTYLSGTRRAPRLTARNASILALLCFSLLLALLFPSFQSAPGPSRAPRGE